MITVRQLLEKINISGRISTDEPMRNHTSYAVGGPADLFLTPSDLGDLEHVLSLAAGEDIPVFILGGGSNILVSDAGIRGIVIDLTRFNTLEVQDGICRCGAGLPISDAAEYACRRGFGGLESFYALPGSVGGAVWMNARCYDISVSDRLTAVRLLNPNGEIETFIPEKDDFDYKKSPFQSDSRVILEAGFRVEQDDTDSLVSRMEEVKGDREQKGHFFAPSAGSVFKNNRSFGRPSGQIIDSLGLRGHRIGHAMVSPYHANFIINTGGATASDVRALIDYVRSEVAREYGFLLEPEILFVGEWEVS